MTASKIKNPFRNADRRKEFDAVVRCYYNKDKALFAHTRAGVIDPSGAVAGRAGNSWSSTFWAGFDGMTHGVRTATPNMITYPWYVAGLAIREAERNQ